MRARLRELNGYRVLYEPGHPSAMRGKVWGGYVYEHTLIVEKFLGRRLYKNDDVHHLDLNRANNRIENLLVLPHDQHMKLHQWLSAGYPMRTEEIRAGLNKGCVRVADPKYCEVCLLTLQHKQKRFCSKNCANKGRSVVNKPSKVELSFCIGVHSWEALGRRYGVVGVTVKNWAKAYDLI